MTQAGKILAKLANFEEKEIAYVQEHGDLPDAVTRMKWRKEDGPEVAEAARAKTQRMNERLNQRRDPGLFGRLLKLSALGKCEKCGTQKVETENGVECKKCGWVKLAAIEKAAFLSQLKRLLPAGRQVAKSGTKAMKSAPKAGKAIPHPDWMNKTLDTVIGGAFLGAPVAGYMALKKPSRPQQGGYYAG